MTIKVNVPLTPHQEESLRFLIGIIEGPDHHVTDDDVQKFVQGWFRNDLISDLIDKFIVASVKKIASDIAQVIRERGIEDGEVSKETLN